MRRWLLACLALAGGMSVNLALELRSAAMARPDRGSPRKSAATADLPLRHPG